MSRNSISVNLSKPSLDFLDTQVQNLFLSRSSYLESILVLDAFKSGYTPTVHELDDLIKGFLMNNNCSISTDFRSQITTFPISGQIELLKFFFSLNLIENFSMSTRKQANFNKIEPLFYFAIGVIGKWKKAIITYVSDLGLKPFTIGPISCPDNEYVFISNLQQFTISKSYPNFLKILYYLGAPPSTTVVQIHYSNLPALINAIKSV